jgi:hypothetical protein
VILQKTVAIGPDDTLGSLYFNQLFPLGVEAMLEAADLMVAQGGRLELLKVRPRRGKRHRRPQDLLRSGLSLRNV